ncbi:hypothetical protein M0R45_015336 [Rubus argutus]|uniref:Uncharacterized protein n=1 Tax=Rubus argutus TaxID=59490 RepID=A0AAW1XRE6_RUBAR
MVRELSAMRWSGESGGVVVWARCGSSYGGAGGLGKRAELVQWRWRRRCDMWQTRRDSWLRDNTAWEIMVVRCAVKIWCFGLIGDGWPRVLGRWRRQVVRLIGNLWLWFVELVELIAGLMNTGWQGAWCWLVMGRESVWVVWLFDGEAVSDEGYCLLLWFVSVVSGDGRGHGCLRVGGLVEGKRTG